MLAVAGIDSSFFGMPLDPMVAAYVYQNPHRLLLYVFMASAGSAVGSLIIYGIGYQGGEALLRRRSPKRFDEIHAGFEEHPFWTLMLPSMLPPPTPFKLFVLGAGVSEMKVTNFLLAIFAGRFIRFLLLGLVTILFGPAIIESAGRIFRQHFGVLIGIVIGAVVMWLIMRRRRRRMRLAESQ